MVNFHNRQNDLREIFIPLDAVIVGCGGVGTWLAIAFALGGTQRLLLIDHDAIEPHNLNRLPYSPDCIGQSKAKVLKDFLLLLGRGIQVVAIDRRFEDAEGFLNAFQHEALYCCTDTSRSQEECYEACQQRGMSYTKIGYDGYNITISELPPPKWGEAQGGYQITPAWAGGAMAAAAYGTMRRAKEEVQLDVRQVLGI